LNNNKINFENKKNAQFQKNSNLNNNNLAKNENMVEDKSKANPTIEITPVNTQKTIKKKISEFLDKNITALIMSLATIYALILSDLNVILFSPDVDIIFNILSGFVFILFLVEFVLSTSTKEDYNGTFFFWLDLLSILSMILNIDWIIYPFLEFFSEVTSSDSSISNLGLQKVVRNLSGVVRLTRYFYYSYTVYKKFVCE
jgi:cytochrome bd-type quinol oxidase subunit 2